jgi:hypothetical protein
MIKEVRLLYAPFRYFVSGHVCLAFKFVDGGDIVISPEAYTKRFVPLLGFLPYYQLHYTQIKFDEYIEKYQKSSRRFHSIKLDIADHQALKLYENMITRVDDLDKRREPYHILFNSCITNTYKHLSQISDFKLGIKLICIPFRPALLAVAVKGTTIKLQ